MEVVQSSVLGRLLLPLWTWLRERYAYSLLARVIQGIARAWSRGCAGSALVGFVTREGLLSRCWKDSVLCRVLTFLISIPAFTGQGRRYLKTASLPGWSLPWWRISPWWWPG